MADLAAQRATPAGRAVAFVAAAAHRFKPGRGRALYVKNAGAGASVVTVPTPGTTYGVAIADIVVSVPAGAERLIDTPPELVTKADGWGDVTFDVTASVTVAQIEVP